MVTTYYLPTKVYKINFATAINVVFQYMLVPELNSDNIR